MSWLSELLGVLTGSGAAGDMADQAGASLDFQKEIYNQFGKPYLQMQLEQMQRFAPYQNRNLSMLQQLSQPGSITTQPVTPPASGPLGGDISRQPVTPPSGSAPMQPAGSSGITPEQLAQLNAFLQQQGYSPITADQAIGKTGGTRPGREGPTTPVTGGIGDILKTDDPNNGSGLPGDGTRPIDTGANTGIFERIDDTGQQPGAPKGEGDTPWSFYGNGDAVPTEGLPWWMQIPQGTTGVDLADTPSYDIAEILKNLPDSWKMSDEIGNAFRSGLDPSQVESQVRDSYNTIADIDNSRASSLRNSALARRMAQSGLTGSSLDISQQYGAGIADEQSAAQRRANSYLAGLQARQGVTGMNADLMNQLAGLQQTESNSGLQRYLTGEGMASDRRGEYNRNQLTLEDLARSRRGEASGNYWNLYNSAAGYPAQLGNAAGAASPWAGMYGQQANNYANMAGQYGNAMSNGIGSLASGLAAWNNWQNSRNTGGAASGVTGSGSASQWLPNLTSQWGYP